MSPKESLLKDNLTNINPLRNEQLPDSDRINKEQHKAIKHGKGPLLIVAGAGTGKTTVISHRIAHLISQKKAKPDEILALTFTEKAASEMQERIDLLVPYGFADVWISTFHSFGNRILEDEAIFLGLTGDFKVMAQPQQVVFCHEHLFEFPMQKLRPLGNPLKHIESILFFFSRLKDEDVSYEEYANYIKLFEDVIKKNPENESLKDEFLVQKELCEIYKKYEDLKMHYGLIDFSDQVWLALKLFRTNSSILEKYRNKFKYILVDEFQDTNYSQFQLLKILLNKEKNITVVGDDDQSIYKFRGAAISNILNFKKAYPSAKQVILTKNYRSGQSILDCAYTLIRYNNPDRLEIRNKINKKLLAVKDFPSAVTHHHFDTVSAEADFVAEKIAELINSHTIEHYKDFAVLVRSNNDANAIIKALNIKNIPWCFSGGSGLYAREEVRVLISFLKTISDLSDNVSLFHLASSEIYKMPMHDLTICMNEASRKKVALYKIFTQFSQLNDITDEGGEIIKGIIADIKKYIDISRELSAGQVLYKFINETGWIKKLADEKTASSIEKVSNIAILFDIIKNFSDVSGNNKVHFLISQLAALIDAGSNPATAEPDSDIDAVNILTIHKSKGLEFSVVFMVSLVQGKFPVSKRKELIDIPDALIKDILPSGDFHKQEERRLFYVGMTRSKDKLYLTSAADYGGQRQRKISQFVYEALSMIQMKISAKKLQPLEAIKKNELTLSSKSSYYTASKKNLSLSHFQIDDYLTCPLKYKYIHILRVPVMANHSIIYGNAMHEAIQFYFKRKIDGNPPGIGELIKKFENKWESTGFLSVEHEEQRMEEGRQALRKFFQKTQKSKTIPKYIEKNFRFNFGDPPLRIIGRFDRVDYDGKDAIIIDFKTSDISKKEEADERAKKSTQLAIYALAWKKLAGTLPKRVELHFVNTGVAGSAVPDEKMINKIEQVIEKVSNGITNANFDANPGYMSCNYCPFSTICPNVKKNS
ncbi:MAG: ATP-dependent helicase [Elusimicrobia bacterium]|nr:ATP-dependent helicase [Elusimicrobiota bacterium]